MAYLLGRDVQVAITTEVDNKAIVFGASALTVDSDGDSVGANAIAERNVSDVFGGDTDKGSNNPMTDVTGIDVSIGAVDEDVAYLGQRTTLKAEIKKETTISITRKKSNNNFELLFSAGRYGLNSADGIQTHTALAQPQANHFGYRVHLAFDDTTDVMSIPHCQVSSYSTTMAADGVQEETIEFMSHVTPIVGSDPNASDITTSF